MGGVGGRVRLVTLTAARRARRPVIQTPRVSSVAIGRIRVRGIVIKNNIVVRSGGHKEHAMMSHTACTV